jgi:hypothetical protein
MKSNLNRKRHFLYCLLTAGLFSCSTLENTTYKRYLGGEFKETQLCGTAKVIMKFDNNVIFKDETGWIEQTFYEPIYKKYNVGDTLYFPPCR